MHNTRQLLTAASLRRVYIPAILTKATPSVRLQGIRRLRRLRRGQERPFTLRDNVLLWKVFYGLYLDFFFATHYPTLDLAAIVHAMLEADPPFTEDLSLADCPTEHLDWQIWPPILNELPPEHQLLVEQRAAIAWTFLSKDVSWDRYRDMAEWAVFGGR